MEKDWMLVLEERYNSQTPAEITSLVNQCARDLHDDEKIIKIISTCRKTNLVTFNQWKALKATLSQHHKKNHPHKQLEP